MTTIAIVGAGPGLGAAVARRFGAEGFSIGLISRSQERADGLAAQLVGEGLQAQGFAADVRDPAGLARTLERSPRRSGRSRCSSTARCPRRTSCVPCSRRPRPTSSGRSSSRSTGRSRPPTRSSPGCAPCATIAGRSCSSTAAPPHPARASRRDERRVRRRDGLRAAAARGARRGGHPRRPARDRRLDRGGSSREGSGEAGRGHLGSAQRSSRPSAWRSPRADPWRPARPGLRRRRRSRGGSARRVVS